MMLREVAGPPHQRVLRAALAAFVALLLICGGAAGLVVSLATDHADDVLVGETQAAALAVGRALDAQVSRALSYGIPLRELEGVNAFLEGTLARVPGVAGVTIEDDDGIAFTTEPSSSVTPLEFTLEGADGIAGALKVYPKAGYVTSAVGRLYLIAALATLLAAVAGALIAGAARFRLIESENDLRNFLRQTAHGTFVTVTPEPPRDRVFSAHAAAASLCERVNARHREVMLQAEEIQGVDFDGTLTTAIDQVTSPLHRRWRFEETRDGRSDDRAQTETLSWSIGVATALAAALGTTLLLAERTIPFGPLGVALAAISLAVAVPLLRRAGPAAVITMLAAGGLLAIACGLLDSPDNAVAYGAAAFCLAGFLGAATTPLPALRHATGIVLMAAVFGPVLGAIALDLLGPVAAPVIFGTGLTALAVPTALARRTMKPMDRPTGDAPAWPERLGVAAAAVVLGAALAMAGGKSPLAGDPLIAGSAIALAGSAAVAAMLPRWPVLVLLAAGGAAFALMQLAIGSPAPATAMAIALAACLAAGIGFGGALARSNDADWRTAAAALLGLCIGQVVLLAAPFGVPAVAGPAAIAAGLSLGAAALGRNARRARRPSVS